MAAEGEGVFSRWFKRWSKKDEPAPLPKPEPKQRVLSTVEIECAAKTKREWLDKQAEDSQRQLVAWPAHLIEGFYVVGLPPDTEVTQIAYDLLGQKSFREADGRTPSGALTPPGMPSYSTTASAAQSTQPSANGAVSIRPTASQGYHATASQGLQTTASQGLHVAASQSFHGHGSGWDGQRVPPGQQVQHLQFRPDPTAYPSHGTPFQANGIEQAWQVPRPASSTTTSVPEPSEHERMRSDLSLQIPPPFLYSQPYMAADTGSPAAAAAFHDASQAFPPWPERAPSSASLRSSRPQLSYDKPPAPSYPASVLFRYPSSAQPTLSDAEIANLCFPHQVAPRRLRRSPSWSELYSVINHKPLITPGTAYIFMAKKVLGLPVYGVCYTVDEPIHRPPTLAQACWPACAAPYRQCLITAPRCYCITSNYPFFDLLCQALNTVVGLERLNRSLAFTAELQTLTHSPSPTFPSLAHTPHYLAAPSHFGGPSGRDSEQQDGKQQGKDLPVDLTRASTGTPRHMPGPGLRVSLHRLSHDSSLGSAGAPPLPLPPVPGQPTAQQQGNPAARTDFLQQGAPFQFNSKRVAAPQGGGPQQSTADTSSYVSSNSIHQASASLPGPGRALSGPVAQSDVEPLAPEAPNAHQYTLLTDDVQPMERSSDATGSSNDQDDEAALSILGSDLVQSPVSSTTSPGVPAQRPAPAGSGSQGGLVRTFQMSRTGNTHNTSVFAQSPHIAAAAAAAADAPHSAASSRQGSDGVQPTDSHQQEVSFGGAWNSPSSNQYGKGPGSMASFHTAADGDEVDGMDVDGSPGLSSARGISQPNSSQSTPHLTTPSRLSRVGVSTGTAPTPQQALPETRSMEVDRNPVDGKEAFEGGKLEGKDAEHALGGACSPTCQGLQPIFHLSPALPSLVVAPGTPSAQAPLPMQTSRASNSLSLSSNGHLTGAEQQQGQAFSGLEPYVPSSEAHSNTPNRMGVMPLESQMRGVPVDSHMHGMPAEPHIRGMRTASGMRFQQDLAGVAPTPARSGSGQVAGLRPQLSGPTLSGQQPSIEAVVQAPPVENTFSPLSVVDSMLGVSLPTPGDQLQVPLPHLPPLMHQRCLLPRRWPVVAPPAALAAYADDELAAELAPWAAALLARSLPLDALLTLLNAALLERPIVVFHPDAALLTSCVLGVLPLLRPFTWQCTVLPMLSERDLLIILKAPVPFLVGCQYKTPEISAECAGLVRVNLYKGSISNIAGLPALPGGKRLAAALAPHHTRLRQSVSNRANDKAVPGPVTEEQAQAATALLTELHAYMTGSMHASANGLNRSMSRSMSRADSLQPANSIGPHGLAPAGRANGSTFETVPAQQHNSSSWWSSLISSSKPSVGAATQASGPSAVQSGVSSDTFDGTWGGIVGELRPHIITHVGPNGERTATLFKESLLEAQPARDRAWVRAFLDTQIFQVYCDTVMAATCESRGRSDS